MLKISEFSHLAHISGRMLRYYDEQGLLKPAYVDPSTGYRYYTLAQLPRFHRLQALKDLGFTLEQIAPLLDQNLSLAELRGMLLLKQAEVQQAFPDARLYYLSRARAFVPLDQPEALAQHIMEFVPVP